MKEELRAFFDEHLEVVLGELPQQVKDRIAPLRETWTSK